MNLRLALIGTFLGLGLLTGCGAPGSPLPPSLELPRSVIDLTATRQGNKVILSWTMPTQTTDGQNVRLKKLGPAQVCRVVNQFPIPACGQVVGEIPAASLKVAKPGDPPIKLTFTDTLPTDIQQQHTTELVTYAVMMTNWRGRSAGLSNQIRTPAAPTLPPPESVGAKITVDGIHLTFACGVARPNPRLLRQYNVYRQTKGTNVVVPIGTITPESSTCAILDRNFDWQGTYYYWVTTETTLLDNGTKVDSVTGDSSLPIQVFAKDIFPPEDPTGVEAVYSGVGQKPFIDLSWAPNAEGDLAGYNIYRHEQGQAAVKINPELVRTPSYRDTNVVAGKTYYYAVSAVDLRGNESGKSEETSERVP